MIGEPRGAESIPFSADSPNQRLLGSAALSSPPHPVETRIELWTMAAITFLVFYSNSMIAPLIPALARGFGVRPYDLKWLIPGFSMLYVVATLLYGVLSDR